MGRLTVIFGFVRLKPWALLLIAAALLGVGVVLQVQSNDRDALKATARLEGPPAAVNITGFDQDTHMTTLREVNVLGQPLLQYASKLALDSNSGDDQVYMVPIAGAKSGDERTIVGIALYDSPFDGPSDITSDLVMADQVGTGPVAPIVAFNGTLKPMGTWEGLTENALAQHGLTVSANVIVVWPYRQGRDVALAPTDADDMTLFGLFSKLAGAVALLALAKLVLGKPSSGPAPAPHTDAATLVHGTPTQQPTQHGPVQVPLWKQRAGLAYDDPQEQTFVQPDLRQIAQDTPTLPARTSNPLRTGLIGIVGLAFAVLLSATVWGLIAGNAKSRPVAAAPTVQETLANGIAEYVVPTADPDRPFYEIDVAPVAQWFVAKWVLALTGDRDAILHLAMIAGGIFAVFVLLPIYFNIRRSLQPRTTARFDSMGIN